MLHYLLFIFAVVFGEDHTQILLNDNDGLYAKFRQMELKLQSVERQMMTRMQKGAVYTRWGRKTCPGNGTELAYTGIAGGSEHLHRGAASEYICLPKDPNLITNSKTQNPHGEASYLYGAEYEDNVFGPKLMQNDVPCAVCYTPHQSVILMIPGKTTCYGGWKKVYFGKLARGSNTQPAVSQFVCLDSYPEIMYNGIANNNGKLFYAVKARCGSLPCPPYINNALLTCVVCSK